MIIDNFSKYVELYATVNVDADAYIQHLIKHIGMFGLMKTIRSDDGSQFTAKVCSQSASLLIINMK